MRKDLNEVSAAQNRILNDLDEIKNNLAELKTVIGYSFTSATTFQKEASSILNNLSVATMDLSGKQEELLFDLEALKEKMDGKSADSDGRPHS